jgi:hypothetical protein
VEQSLLYVREVLAPHTENSNVGKSLFKKITKGNYASEEQFIRDLSEDESKFLNQVLKEAIDYSSQEQDSERARQLNDVYELLFI